MADERMPEKPTGSELVISRNLRPTDQGRQAARAPVQRKSEGQACLP